MLPVSVKTKQKHIDQVRIVPRNGYYAVEVIYEKTLFKPTLIHLSVPGLTPASQT